MLDLIRDLQNQPARRILPSRIGDRARAGDHGILDGRVESNPLGITLAVPSVDHIVRNEPNQPTWSDADIWHAVFEVVTRTNLATPSAAFEKAF